MAWTTSSLQGTFASEIENRWLTGDDAVHFGQVLAATELTSIIAQQHHGRSAPFELARHRPCRILEQPDHAEHGRRVNGFAFRFVVEADVSAGDRDAEGAARVADAAHRLGKLPHDLRPFGIAEVEVVGGADRLAARARDIARRFGDGEHRAAIGIEITEAAVAIDRDRQAPATCL